MPASSRLPLIALFAAAAMAASAQRAPTVSYTVSGSAGDWTLDFTVQNNFNSGEGSLYFFGVNLDSGNDVSGSPSQWDPTLNPTWNPLAQGNAGPSETFNNTWTNPTIQTFPQNLINPGQSLSGFDVVSTDASAPTSVDYFAYAAGGTYTGNDYFGTNTNPGFSGDALPPSGSPEPFTMGSIVLCLGGAIKRKLSKRSSN
jgi:hypothetical protein